MSECRACGINRVVEDWWLEVRMDDGVWESEGRFSNRDGAVRYAKQGGDGPWRVSPMYAGPAEPIE